MRRISGSPATPETHTGWEETFNQNRDRHVVRLGTVPADSRGIVSTLPAPARSLRYSVDSSSALASLARALGGSTPNLEQRPEVDEVFGEDSPDNARAKNGTKNGIINRNSTGHSSAGSGGHTRNLTETAKNLRLRDGGQMFTDGDFPARSAARKRL
jgi:hypothetical protein